MKEEHRRLSGAYAVDAVTDEERAAHEVLMREDPDVAEETRSLTEAVSELSKVSEQAPPQRLRADVLNAIKSVRPLPPHAPEDTAEISAPDKSTEPTDQAEPDELSRRRSRKRGTWLGAIAAAAAAMIAVVVVLVGQRDVGPANQAQSVISASDVNSQTAIVDDWSATLYLSQEQGKAVIASEQMPDAPVGRDFQVWLKHDDGSFTSAGVMPRTDGDGQEFVVSGVIDQVVAIAVSEEPAGGSPGPTTTPILTVDIE